MIVSWFWACPMYSPLEWMNMIPVSPAKRGPGSAGCVLFALCVQGGNIDGCHIRSGPWVLSLMSAISRSSASTTVP